MSIHEHLPPQARKQLKEVGWTKGLELAKLGKEGWAALRLCNLVAQSASPAKRGFQAGGREGINGRETEQWEIIYFKLYQSQMPVIERAIERQALMLGSDRSEVTVWR